MVAALSPSRASDFMQCPLLYRFRVIDRLPEPPSPAAARGTLVHSVLERVFEELSFTAPDRSGDSVTVDAAFVEEYLGELSRSTDLSRYVL